MMNRPSVDEILKPGQSYYSLVIAVAKRTREIVDSANELGDIIEEKPVSLAVDEFSRGKYKIIEQEDIGSTIE